MTRRGAGTENRYDGASTRPRRRRRGHRGVLRLVAVAAVLVSAAGCADVASTPTAASSVPPISTSPAPGSVPPDLTRFYSQRPTWGSCLPFATTDDQKEYYGQPGMECAKVDVPADYTNPQGRTAQIAISRLKATDPTQRIGSLLVNPGGPGASGIEIASQLSLLMKNTEVARKFDLVGFDPRGTGASTPTIHCLTAQQQDAQRDTDILDPSPAGVAKAEAAAKQTADGCAQKTGVDLLANVGTRDVARDMDVLRSVLGDKQLNYIGYSYGTRIGSTYAEQFPKNVRAMVLDGAVDPDQDPTEQLIDQGRGFQGAFEAFAKDCSSKPGCPLGTDPAQATARYQQLTRPLIANPIKLPDGRVLSYNDAQQGTIQALYATSMWPQLRQGITELTQGQGQSLMNLADQYYDRAPDGTYSPQQDAFNAIRCVDDPQVRDHAQALDRANRYNEAAPFLDSGRGASSALDTCGFWPTPATGGPHLPKAPGLAPPLVVSTTGDPATPYQAGVDLAKSLNGSLLTKVGTQHTASFQGFPCVDAIVTRYLVDGTPAPPNAKCPENG
ncbi:alpha/beta hydrolase [Actinomycetospora endophytica]|uniref:Alpha/beta hydrolase n=1 Tax=Actinomycetospora endophytica TaxID=2291215 RepID=A0ABS8PHS3_9PSEU|nr:alpha/beta hydrolase [Actinomycetospora endophytica]MCD2196539.1 alpha/beta hydrolase [Actinomycetospora endophytica]